jgi:hypothetical protein
VKLAPPSPSSTYADKGTLLHNLIAEILDTDTDPVSLIGTNYEGIDSLSELLHVINMMAPKLKDTAGYLRAKNSLEKIL